MAKISNNKENEPVVENGKKKKEEKPATKVVVRRLPPTMTEEQFKMQVSPLPDNDYFYYVPADMSLMPNAFCRAYINFINQSDLFIFTQKFDGYVFLDSKGGEFPAVVEFAPFQRIPKNRPHRRKDPKTGTIELDPVFLKFKERLEAQTLENKAATNASKQHFFETSLLPEKKETNNTPLIDFIKNKRAERQRIRDEKREEKRKKDLERRKAKEELRRTKKEDETSVVKPSTPQSMHPKSNDTVEKFTSDKSSRDKNVQDCQFMANNLQKEECTQQKIEINEQNVTQKVRDIVSLFNESLNPDNIKGTDIKNKTALLNCKHKDIESQIIKNVDKDYKRLNYKESSGINLPTNKIPLLNGYNELNYLIPMQGVPSAESRPKVYVQHPTTPCRQTHQSIGIKPFPIISNNSGAEEDSKTDEFKKDPKKVSPTDVFRKNLQKVVTDVLGHSKVKSPRKNVISKPKMFLQRPCVVSGESSSRPCFNSSNFYLPPRTFGFGQNTSKPIKEDSIHCVENFNSELASAMNKFGDDKQKLPIGPRKRLPPFSNKLIFSSKSDGDIDKNDNFPKVGGSNESLKKQAWGGDLKQAPFRRPHVTPKQSVILEKTTKISL